MRFFQILLAVFLALALPGSAEWRGVINDPDGFTNVRAKQNADAPIVGKIVAGKVFEFDTTTSGFVTWVQVSLHGGKSGWMHASRVRMYANIDELATDGGANDEINIYGRKRKLEYYPLARSAARGEAKGLQRYLAIDDTDGGAAETHYEVLRLVIHILGDEKLAKFLSGQSAKYRANVAENITSELVTYPFEPKAYFARNFPKTVKVLGQN
jgi:hypothetical protein